MLRMIVLAVLAFACNSEKANKAREALDKVDKALDDDDAADARRHLTSAQEAIGKGGDAAEDCAWAARVPDDLAADPVKAPVRELKKLCKVEVPLARATRAVVKAEKAKAEQPEAPSFTECSSDEWAQAKATFDDMATPDQRFVALKARWAKVCP